MGKSKISQVGLILAPTIRSRAYVQMLAARGISPAEVYFLPGVEEIWTGSTKVSVTPRQDMPTFCFSPGVSAVDTVQSLGWSSVVLPHEDINADANVTFLESCRAKVLVYSGKPKALLTGRILEIGLRFLHVHGGYLPAYRAATGFYFGLLERGLLGQSGLWLDAGVDTGPIVARRWYTPDPNVDVDCIQDPVTRADLLVEIIAYEQGAQKFPSVDDPGPSENYFVIHPVLKHLALRRARIVAPGLDLKAE